MTMAPIWLQFLAILTLYASFPLITSLFKTDLHPYFGAKGIQNTFYLVACLFNLSLPYVFFQSRIESLHNTRVVLYFLVLTITWQVVNFSNPSSQFLNTAAHSLSLLSPQWVAGSLIFPFWLTAVSLLIGFSGKDLIHFSRENFLGKTFFSVLLVGVFFITLALFSLDALKNRHHEVFQKFWLTHPDYLLAFGLIYVWTGRPQNGALLMNPAQTLWSIPWPASVAIAKSEWLWRWWWKGAVNLLTAIAALLIDLLFLSQLNEFHLFSSGHFYLRALSLYFHFMLISIAGWNSVCAIGRFYGLKAPEATQFQIFAHHPLALFLRKSTYVASFLRDTLWLPMAHKTKRPWLSLFAVAVLVAFYIPIMHRLVIPIFFHHFFPSLPETRTDLFYFGPQALGQTFLWSVALLIWPAYKIIDRWCLNSSVRILFIFLNHFLCAISVELFSQWIRSWNVL